MTKIKLDEIMIPHHQSSRINPYEDILQCNVIILQKSWY